MTTMRIFSRTIAICARKRSLTTTRRMLTTRRTPMQIARSHNAWRKFHQDGACRTVISEGARINRRNDCGVPHNPPLCTRQTPVTRTSLLGEMASIRSSAVSVCALTVNTFVPLCRRKVEPSGGPSRGRSFASMLTRRPSNRSSGPLSSKLTAGEGDEWPTLRNKASSSIGVDPPTAGKPDASTTSPGSRRPSCWLRIRNPCPLVSRKSELPGC